MSIGLEMAGLIGIGGVYRDRGFNRDRVRAGEEHIIPFEKHPPPPPSQKKKKLTRKE